MPHPRLFHYTTASRLVRIIEAGQILPAAGYVPVGERAVVWLSHHQIWEPTASKGILNPDGTQRSATFDEMVALDTPARIEVSPAAGPLQWREWSVRSGVARKIAKSLRRTAEKQGARVTEWRMNFEPVDQCHWLALELFVGGEWKACPLPPE